MHPERPPIDRRTRHLVRQVAQANPLWGAPRIHSTVGAAAFVGTWSCQETTTLMNTSPDAGPRTMVQSTVWTITAGANGQIAIAATSAQVSCNYNATISGSTATLSAGQVCITPPLTGSDGVAKIYTVTLSSGGATVSGNTMVYSTAANTDDSTCLQGWTVTGTSTGTCTR